MTTIVTRAGKGSPLTWDEMDANFTNLQTTADAAVIRAGDTMTGPLGFTAQTTPTTPAATTGVVWASSSNSHVSPQFTGSDGFTANLVRDNIVLVRNTSGSAMTKGQLVYITGSTGQVPNVSLAIATSETTTADGWMAEDVANNGFGWAIVVGSIPTMNTNAYAEGTQLFLSGTTAGAYTTTTPGYPYLAQEVGMISYQHAVNGIIGANVKQHTHPYANTSESIGFRNRVINGDMRIDQRSAGAVSTDGSYAVDRWVTLKSGTGALTLQKTTTGTPPTGFTHYVRVTCTTADTSAAGEYYSFRQNIEGTNVADLGFGLSTAQTVTLSFRVRSSLTGTFSGVLQNSANNRSYPFTYSISAANTWEYKTITVTGDTSGTWLTDTGVVGLRVNFDLGSGSTYLGTANAWVGSSLLGVTGQTAFMANLNATWDITGVQLEVGSVTTPFERRPYTVEMGMCQRYYASWQILNHYIPGTTATLFYLPQRYPVSPMCTTTPTVTIPAASANGGMAYNSSGSQVTPTTWAAEAANEYGFRIAVGHASGIGGHIVVAATASAEL